MSMRWCRRLHLREDDGAGGELDGGEDGEAGGGCAEQRVEDAAAHRLVRQALHPWYAGTVTAGNDRRLKNALNWHRSSAAAVSLCLLLVQPWWWSRRRWSSCRRCWDPGTWSTGSGCPWCCWWARARARWCCPRPSPPSARSCARRGWASSSRAATSSSRSARSASPRSTRPGPSPEGSSASRTSSWLGTRSKWTNCSTGIYIYTPSSFNCCQCTVPSVD